MTVAIALDFTTNKQHGLDEKVETQDLHKMDPLWRGAKVLKMSVCSALSTFIVSERGYLL